MYEAQEVAALIAERASLEEDVASLKTELAGVRARIEKADTRGPRSNGFGWGMLLGLLLVSVSIGWVFFSWARFMGSMG